MRLNVMFNFARALRYSEEVKSSRAEVQTALMGSNLGASTAPGAERAQLY